MVYSSIPAYLDPANWHQQPPPPSHQQAGGHANGGVGVSSHMLLPPPPPPPPQPHGGGGAGTIRPGSMADRARMANIPMPEAAMKCPRCDSTNTKFCYFNNYSLSQPRHFCKTCRRYWTRGGALRSVPVGGGCRRNKRSKGSSSKSPAASGDHQTCSSGSINSLTSSGAADHIIGLGPQGGPLRFMAPLHNFSEFSNNYGLNIPGLVGSSGDFNFHSSASLLGLGGEQQWRVQPQYPFVDPTPAAGMLYPFEHQGGVEASSTFVRPRAPATAVKVEDSNQQMSLSMQLLGSINGGNDQFWSGGGSGAWTDLSAFSSSSTRHP